MRVTCMSLLVILLLMVQSATFIAQVAGVNEDLDHSQSHSHAHPVTSPANDVPLHWERHEYESCSARQFFEGYAAFNDEDVYDTNYLGSIVWVLNDEPGKQERAVYVQGTGWACMSNSSASDPMRPEDCDAQQLDRPPLELYECIPVIEKRDVGSVASVGFPQLLMVMILIRKYHRKIMEWDDEDKDKDKKEKDDEKNAHGSGSSNSPDSHSSSPSSSSSSSIDKDRHITDGGGQDPQQGRRGPCCGWQDERYRYWRPLFGPLTDDDDPSDKSTSKKAVMIRYLEMDHSFYSFFFIARGDPFGKKLRFFVTVVEQLTNFSTQCLVTLALIGSLQDESSFATTFIMVILPAIIDGFFSVAFPIRRLTSRLKRYERHELDNTTCCIPSCGAMIFIWHRLSLLIRTLWMVAFMTAVGLYGFGSNFNRAPRPTRNLLVTTLALYMAAIPYHWILEACKAIILCIPSCKYLCCVEMFKKNFIQRCDEYTRRYARPPAADANEESLHQPSQVSKEDMHMGPAPNDSSHHIGGGGGHPPYPSAPVAPVYTPLSSGGGGATSSPSSSSTPHPPGGPSSATSFVSASAYDAHYHPTASSQTQSQSHDQSQPQSGYVPPMYHNPPPIPPPPQPQQPISQQQQSVHDLVNGAMNLWKNVFINPNNNTTNATNNNPLMMPLYQHPQEMPQAQQQMYQQHQQQQQQQYASHYPYQGQPPHAAQPMDNPPHPYAPPTHPSAPPPPSQSQGVPMDSSQGQSEPPPSYDSVYSSQHVGYTYANDATMISSDNAANTMNQPLLHSTYPGSTSLPSQPQPHRKPNASL